MNIILENGFWSRAAREDYRKRAADLGVQAKVHLLDVSRDELIERLKDLWSSWFEQPGAAEME